MPTYGIKTTILGAKAHCMVNAHMYYGKERVSENCVPRKNAACSKAYLSSETYEQKYYRKQFVHLH
jgi:hypothetical protein